MSIFIYVCKIKIKSKQSSFMLSACKTICLLIGNKSFTIHFLSLLLISSQFRAMYDRQLIQERLV